MATLHERLSARIEELERVAKAVGEEWGSDAGWRQLAMVWSLTGDLETYVADHTPALVLRGLAEDRDILARHTPTPRDTAAGASTLFCPGCSIFDGLSGHAAIVRADKCRELPSLARRHGINPEEV